MSKCQPSQKEGVKHRDTVGMHRYNCKSKLNIAYRTNTSGEKTYVITISLKHHLKHTLLRHLITPRCRCIDL